MNFKAGIYGIISLLIILKIWMETYANIQGNDLENTFYIAMALINFTGATIGLLIQNYMQPRLYDKNASEQIKYYNGTRGIALILMCVNFFILTGYFYATEYTNDFFKQTLIALVFSAQAYNNTINSYLQAHAIAGNKTEKIELSSILGNLILLIIMLCVGWEIDIIYIAIMFFIRSILINVIYNGRNNIKFCLDWLQTKKIWRNCIMMGWLVIFTRIDYLLDRFILDKLGLKIGGLTLSQQLVSPYSIFITRSVVQPASPMVMTEEKKDIFSNNLNIILKLAACLLLLLLLVNSGISTLVFEKIFNIKDTENLIMMVCAFAIAGTIDGFNQIKIYRLNKDGDSRTQYVKTAKLQLLIIPSKIVAIIQFGIIGIALVSIVQSMITTYLLKGK